MTEHIARRRCRSRSIHGRRDSIVPAQQSAEVADATTNLVTSSYSIPAITMM